MTISRNAAYPQRVKLDRPTVGVLAGLSTLEGSTPDNYRASVIRGIQSAARSRECHLLLSWGIRRITEVQRIYPSWPMVSQGTDFVPVGPWNTDGLIVFTPLASEERSSYIQQLISNGLPVLFVATGEQGPTIAVNNTQGIRQAVAHLVEHGHQCVAFIAGLPTDMGDSASRFSAYSTAVAEFNLDPDPALVVWGWHDFTAGHRAMQELLRSRVKFTAVLASNDNSAIGAMRAIREAGLRIPADIAIIGFDDQPIAAAQVPPLSSVHVSLPDLGEQALVTMLDMLGGEQPPGLIQIPTRVMKRQSCGCMPEAISSAIDATPRIPPAPAGQDRPGSGLREQKKQLVNELLDTLPARLRFPGGDAIRRDCETLVQTFYQSLKRKRPRYFQTAFMECIQALEREDGSLEPWQQIISVLRREMTLLPLEWQQDEVRQLADNLLHQARVVVGESAERQDQRHQYQRALRAVALNGLTAGLSSAMSTGQVAKTLQSHLAGVGIRHARVQVFEAERDDPVAWSIVLDVEGGPPARRFPSRQFPPRGLYPVDELLNVILLPLVFQGEALGYVAFDASDLGACAAIAMQLAATIKVSQLHARVVELSLTDSLTGLQNRRYFEVFLKNEFIRSQRFSRKLAVILVDVDRFKDYNDSHGHPAGDEALQQVAKCLSQAHRNADIVARIGGDEFVLILPETDHIGALQVSRKIRLALAETTGLKNPLSVSIGIAALGPGVTDAETLIEQADNALYESKRTGRNRISIYQPKGIVAEDEFSPPV